MNNLFTLSRPAIEYLCKCINLTASVTDAIDDINLRSDGTFSSVKIDTLLNTLKTDCNEYTDRLVANLSRLELKIANDESEITQPNIMYLYKPAGATSYDQYVVIEGNKVLLGTTDIDMGDYYTIAQADAKFCLITDYNSLKTNYETHRDNTDIHITTDERTKWDKVIDKVDKTSIITTKSDSATDEQLYSAKGMNSMLYNYVKKTDLSTINAVPDLNTFKGNTFMVGRGSGYNDETINIPNGVTGTFVVGYTPWNNGNNYGVQRLTTVEGKCVTYERNLNNGTWGTWNKLCYTSVADIPQTVFKFDDETKYRTANSETTMYEVVDGECEISLFVTALNPSNTTQATVIPDYGLPKPRMPIYITLNGWGNTNDTALAIIKTSGRLTLMKGTANGMYLGYCKYKVAE